MIREGLEYPIIENVIVKSRDLPGVDLETTIKAGNKSGTSSLQLNADHDLINGYFGYSNGLSESAGKDQFTSRTTVLIVSWDTERIFM